MTAGAAPIRKSVRGAFCIFVSFSSSSSSNPFFPFLFFVAISWPIFQRGQQRSASISPPLSRYGERRRLLSQKRKASYPHFPYISKGRDTRQKRPHFILITSFSWGRKAGRTILINSRADTGGRKTWCAPSSSCFPPARWKERERK